MSNRSRDDLKPSDRSACDFFGTSDAKPDPAKAKSIKPGASDAEITAPIAAALQSQLDT